MKTRKMFAFTLIELLVVIAIIALLLAILAPALTKVKEKAQLVVCASNQRQLIIGLSTYANSADSKLPPSISKTASGGYHRPFELNYKDNTPSVDLNPDPKNYIASFLGSYLEEVGTFNCKMAPISAENIWPPQESGLAPEGTYGQFYRDGTYNPLHATYTLFWNYQGFNTDVSGAAVDLGYGDFEAPTNVNQGTKLIVQDSLFYAQLNASNILWANSGQTWYSSHRFKDAGKGNPYFMTKSAIAPSVIEEAPVTRLNAGYVDGHVERFSSKDGIVIKQYNITAVLPRKR